MVDIIRIHIKHEVSHIVCTYVTHFRKITWILFFKVVLITHLLYGSSINAVTPKCYNVLCVPTWRTNFRDKLKK